MATNSTRPDTPGVGDLGPKVFTVKVEETAQVFDTATLNITVEAASAFPALSIQMSGSNLKVLRPTGASGYTLYGGTNLIPSAVWSSVTNPPIIQGDDWMVTIPIDEAPSFFHLEAQ